MIKSPSGATNKIVTMNIVAAVLWALLYLPVFFLKASTQISSKTLMINLVMCGFLVIVLTSTAIALSSPSRTGQRKVMVILNEMLILLVMFEFVQAVYFKNSLWSYYLVLSMVLIPAGLNVKALQRLPIIIK